MWIAILIFEKLTALDAIGPYEVLRSVPGWEVRFVGPEKGPVRTDSGALGSRGSSSSDSLRGSRGSVAAPHTTNDRERL